MFPLWCRNLKETTCWWKPDNPNGELLSYIIGADTINILTNDKVFKAGLDVRCESSHGQKLSGVSPCGGAGFRNPRPGFTPLIRVETATGELAKTQRRSLADALQQSGGEDGGSAAFPPVLVQMLDRLEAKSWLTG